MSNHKFMQVLDPRIFAILKKRARIRGVTVQELIRVRIVPEWLTDHPEETRCPHCGTMLTEKQRATGIHWCNKPRRKK
jgi:hypothetical protein